MGRLRLLFQLEISLLSLGTLAALVARLVTRDSDWSDLALTFVCTGAVVLAMQALILLPVKRARARRERGVPLFVSLGAGALLVALVCGGFAMGLFHALVAASEKDGTYLLAGLATFVVSWPVGTLLFIGYAKRRRDIGAESLLSQGAHLILKGTAFEALAMVPLDAIIRQRSECYCVAGSVFNWAICVAVGVIVFGPAAVLPALVREREPWYRQRCDRCARRPEEGEPATGYRGPEVGVCPHCGFSSVTAHPKPLSAEGEQRPT